MKLCCHQKKIKVVLRMQHTTERVNILKICPECVFMYQLPFSKIPTSNYKVIWLQYSVLLHGVYIIEQQLTPRSGSSPKGIITNKKNCTERKTDRHAKIDIEAVRWEHIIKLRRTRRVQRYNDDFHKISLDSLLLRVMAMTVSTTTIA